MKARHKALPIAQTAQGILAALEANIQVKIRGVRKVLL